MTARRRPNFLILGAAKCGTTSLYHSMGQHPDVFFSSPKEPVFFEAEYERGPEFYWERYFGGWAGQRAVGEARVYNLFLPFVPARIAETLGEVRLIAILRNPIDRAYSHWWHRFSHGQERLDFETALLENRKRLESGRGFAGREGVAFWREGLTPETGGTRHRVYLDAGYYAEQLARYQELFPASHLKVLLYEDLARDATAVTAHLWRFVGVDPEGTSPDATPRNTAREVRQSRAAWHLRRLDRRLGGVGARLPAALKRAVWRLFPGRPAQRPPLGEATRAWLADHYAPHNRRLEGLLGRDLSAWDRPGEGAGG